MQNIDSKKKSNFKETMESYLSSPVVKSFLAGSFSGTCSTILFQPFDLVKTRIQSQKWEPEYRAHGIFSVTVSVVKNEKLRGLWKGVTPSLTRTVPGIGVYFCSLHTIRSRLESSDPHPLESALLGAAARSVSGLVILPITVIKTRFESGHFNYGSMSGALVSIYRMEGMKGLFSGLTATLLRDAPFSGIYLMFYTQLNKSARNSSLTDPQAPMVHFSCGIVAGCLAALVTQPADVVKTHMQLKPSDFQTVKYTVKHIMQRQGAAGFFIGTVPRTLRRSLMAAMAWTVYEQAMKSIGLK